MLNRDFREMLLCLKSARADFIVVGAYALAAHGFPRATGDIDIWIRNTPENAQKVMTALVEFGAPLTDLSTEDFIASDSIVQIGVEPRRIDLLTRIDGVEFEEAWSHKLEVTVDNVSIYVLSRTDLLKNKKTAGRAKDQVDIVWLEKDLNNNE